MVVIDYGCTYSGPDSGRHYSYYSVVVDQNTVT